MSLKRAWFICVVFLVMGMVTPLMAADKIDINTATAEELAVLDQIGPIKAAAIVEYRKANGPFTTTEDLMKVNGIGEKIFGFNKDRVTVSAPSSGAVPKTPSVTTAVKPPTVPTPPAVPAVPEATTKKK